MVDFLFHLWFWLIACLAVGVGAGLLVRRAPRRGGIARWLLWSGLAFAMGVIAAALGVLAGAPALFLESGLAAFAAFLLGAVGGTLAGGGSLREHEGWALGLIPAGLIWWGATLFAQPWYEEGLKRGIVALAERTGVDASGVTVSGRDVSAPAAVAENAQLMAEIEKIAGVRRVTRAREPEKTAQARPPEAPATAPKVDGPATPTEEPERRAAIDAGDKDLAPECMDRAKAGKILAGLPAEGAFDAATCRAALSASVALDKIQFRTGRATIVLAMASALDKAAALLRRCPNAAIEVRGHADDVGSDAENDALSRRRAEAVVRYLRLEGVDRGRLRAAGYGARKPIAPDGDESGRAQNRYVDFAVK
jgi:outer membrane protein OmpA-like peptidoglycan-associated protein